MYNVKYLPVSFSHLFQNCPILYIYLGFRKKFLAEIRIFLNFQTCIDKLFNQHWAPVCNFHGVLVHGTMLTFVCIFSSPEPKAHR